MPDIIPATCVSCQDSSLSTTASIIGIMTFVFAFLAGSRFHLESLRHPLDEHDKLVEESEKIWQREAAQ